MKAIILPLEGKYHGTEIMVSIDSGHDYSFKLWNNASREPSDRELSGICTIDQWRNNENLTIDYVEVKAKDAVVTWDNHFESRDTHLLAKKIVDLINSDADPIKIQNPLGWSNIP